MRKIGIVMAALAVTAWSATAAYACKGEEVLFEDDFSNPDTGWGQAEGYVSFVDGQLQIAFPVDTELTVPNESSLYDDVDLCVTTTHVKGQPDKSWAGLVFWLGDLANQYVFAVSPAGTWAVIRRTKGKWLFPVSWRTNLAIKQGEGAVNDLRVVTKGKTATFFINETEVGRIKGSPPQGGYIIGVAAEQFPGSTTVEAFDDFKVIQPE